MKKALTLLAVLCLGLSATACTHRSNQQYYERAQLYLGAENYESAAELFSQLGEYEEAADYSLYASALAAMQEGEWALARANLKQIIPFKSSERYLRFIEAAECEEAGKLEEALAIYESLGTFRESDQFAGELRTAIPEKTLQQARALMAQGDYAEARELLEALDGYGQSALLAKNCTTALNKAAYTEADALCESGDHLGAMQAFLALGEVLDAPARAEQCRAALFLALDKATAEVTIDTAAGLIAAYEAIDDPAAAQQAAALAQRFGTNLLLLEKASDQPYVLLGEYPMGESGLESPLMWRVLSVQGAQVTLLCESVIDASPTATLTDLLLTDAEQTAVSSATLPSAADLASLSDLSCMATPYAVAQGVQQANGLALYWLRDSLENGIHPVVSSAGSLTIPALDETPGIRPMLTLSLENYTFTAGDGTKEDPFR